MTVLRGSVDEFDIDLFGLPRLDGGEDALSESDGSLSGAHDTTLDKNEVLVDLTVMGEATKRSDVLGNGVSLGGRVVLNTTDGTGSNSVDLVVDLSTGVITELTTSGDRPLDGRGMPGTDTGDLSETSMRLTVQSADTESLDDTACSLTTGNTNGINALGHLEDLADADLLLELVLRPVDLLGDGTSVDLDLEDVSLVLAERKLADLGGADNTDDSGVLLDSLKISGEMSLGGLVLVLAVDVLGESLLLGVHPVLVESALDIVIQVLSPDGREGTEATGGLHVTNKSNDLHGGALNDGDGVDDILLDGLLTLTSLLVLDDVGHASLVAHEGGKVNRLGRIVAGERSNATTVVTCTSLWQISQGTASWVLKLSMGHFYLLPYLIMINAGVERTSLLIKTNALFNQLVVYNEKLF